MNILKIHESDYNIKHLQYKALERIERKSIFTTLCALGKRKNHCISMSRYNEKESYVIHF